MKSTPALFALVFSLLLPTLAASAQDAPASNAVPAKKTVPSTAPKADTIPTLAAGATAPDFMAKDFDGKEVRLSDWQNKVVVLDFWATWCGPCKASLPHTQEVAKRFHDQGVVVLANCTSDTRAKFLEFVKANHEKYSDIIFTCDPNDRGSDTYAERVSHKLYGVTGIPTQFVIGRDGKIAAVLVGYGSGDHQLEEALAKLGLNAEPSPAPVPAKTGGN